MVCKPDENTVSAKNGAVFLRFNFSMVWIRMLTVSSEKQSQILNTILFCLSSQGKESLYTGCSGYFFRSMNYKWDFLSRTTARAKILNAVVVFNPKSAQRASN